VKRERSLVTTLFRLALRVMAPSLAREEREEAAETFRGLAREARQRGGRAYLGFLLREIRALVTTRTDEGRERRSTRAGAGAPGLRSPGTSGFAGRVADVFRQDVRYALRSLRRSPLFVTVSVLSLTFGISVSTGLFSVANAVLLRPLPYAAEPERLVRVFSTSRGSDRGLISYADFEELRPLVSTLTDVAAVRDQNMVLGSAVEGTRRRWGMEVSDNYFRVLGISMARGRSFEPEDVAAGRRVVVIGYHVWQDLFEGDPAVLGRTLTVNGKPHTVIGVAPERMVGLQGPAVVDVVIPSVDEAGDQGGAWSTLVGRLRPGVTPEQAQAEMDALASRFRESHPDTWNSRAFGPQGLKVMTLAQALLPPGPAAVLMMVAFLAVVALILLIACSNVANLLLTRAMKRRDEVAIRSAVGASGKRILAQLLTENLILFGVAGALSLLLIHYLSVLAATGASFLPAGQANIEVDWRVVAFALGLAVATGLTFGLLPVVQAARPNLVSALKGRQAPPRHRLLGIRNLLVGAQVGGSLVLVLVSLLLAQSVSHADRLDLGFKGKGVAVLELNLANRDYDEVRARGFLEELRSRVDALPGVSGSALASGIPVRGSWTYMDDMEPEGYDPAPEERVEAEMNVVTPGYLQLMGIRLLRGRDLSSDDRMGGEPVVLVNKAFVDKYWPGDSGIGKYIRSGDRLYRVVGVVDDIAWRLPGEDPAPFLWLPVAQYYDPHVAVHVRTSGDVGELLASLRRVVLEMDPQMPILRLDRMETLTATATQLHRSVSKALGLAGLITLCLAMLGIYGVVAFSVSQRTREVGIRVALGADRDRVVRMILREGMVLAMVGLVPGLIVSLVTAALMRAALLGLQPLDPMAFGGSIGLLLMSVLGASWAPAWRAARSDPMRALREE
jgi:putative ABC transport system permease protein